MRENLEFRNQSTWKVALLSVLSFFCLQFTSDLTLASQRVALVIGNAAYQHAPGLANPLNDASDVGDAFQRLGFSVTLLANTDSDSLRRSLRDFRKAASASSIAVIFYAGHGIEIDGRNFLIPVDAKLDSDQDVEYETIPLELVSGATEGASELQLIILDACRDNPFAASMQRKGSTRSIGRGLARVEPSGETLVAYAAKGGTVAMDGDGRNSPYTKSLLTYLERPELEVFDMFRHIRDAVLAQTGGRQEPFTYGSLSAKGVYLASAPEVQESVPEQVSPLNAASISDHVDKEYEIEFWNSIKNRDDANEFRAYLESYPDGRFAALARNRLNRLEGLDNEDATSEPVEEQSVDLPSLNLSRQESRLIQRGLAHLGFKPGPVDGLFGSRTRQAIESWQEASGHERTGRLLRAQADALAEIGKEAIQEDEKKAEAVAEREAERKAKEERERNRLSPGQEFRDCADCPLMTVIPGGTYTMGSPASEEGRGESEGPQHQVSIEKFAVGKFEVMRREYRVFVSETGHYAGNSCEIYENGVWKERTGRNWESPGFSQTDQHPVVCISWDDAKAYVRWLSRKTGHQYRLLSESEWEYAARASTKGAFHFDSTISTDQANYNGNYTYGNGRKGVCTAKEQRRLEVFRRTGLACMMCTAMFMSGSRTAGMRVMQVLPTY